MNKLDDYISDAISDFLYYDREEDEDLPAGEIERMIEDGEVTVDQITEMFKKHLEEGLGSFTGNECSFEITYMTNRNTLCPVWH